MPRLENAEIAAIFAEMADLTHIVGGNEHRIRSFRRAARVIESQAAGQYKLCRRSNNRTRLIA